MKPIWQKIFFLLLLLLPITDYLFNLEVGGTDSNISIFLRALVLIVMLFPIIFKGKVADCPTNRILLVFIFYVSLTAVLYQPGISAMYSLVRALYSLLGFMFFYYLSTNDRIDEKQYCQFIFLLAIILFGIVFHNIGNRQETARGLTMADNTGYAVLCCFPAVILLANKKSFLWCLAIVVVATLLAGKRGAVIALLIGLIVVLRFLFKSKIYSKTKVLFLIGILVVLGIVAFYLWGDYFNATWGRFQNLEEDNGSGRGLVYKWYWDNSISSSIFNLIFGHGLYSGPTYRRVAAHNDWLELLFECGVVGVFLYFILLLSLVNVLIQNKGNKNKYYYTLLLSLVVWFIKSIFSSTFLMDMSSIYLYGTAAYSLGKIKQSEVGDDNLSC